MQPLPASGTSSLFTFCRNEAITEMAADLQLELRLDSHRGELLDPDLKATDERSEGVVLTLCPGRCLCACA